MMKIVVAIDKFKGSLSCFDACKQIQNGIEKVRPSFNVVTFPMADGGDGFAQVLKHYLKTNTVWVNTVDPIHRKIKGYYEWNSAKKVAIIELAVASGLVLLKNNKRNPLVTSTLGTGILIQHAIDKGAKKIILGLGGSATNDGGMGIAHALGFRFKDISGNQLAPSGAALVQIKHIEKPAKFKKINLVIACDVNNPLCGKNGASYVYGPQKGASPKAVEFLDKGLKNLANVIYLHTGKKVANILGVGAAGGVSAILNGYYNVKMMKGIDLVLQTSNITKSIQNADLLITGEGKIDNQSLSGKVVGSLVEMAKINATPVLLIAGIIDLPSKSELKKLPIIQLADKRHTIKYSISNAAIILHSKVQDYFINMH